MCCRSAPARASTGTTSMARSLKINNSLNPPPANPPTGYKELLIAREGLTASKTLHDPEGNQVTLVPPGTLGVGKIGIRLGVRDLAAHRRFYTEALGLAEEAVEGAGAAFRAGDSIILVDEDTDAPADALIGGYGWRYITFQIFKVDEEHAFALAHGGQGGPRARYAGRDCPHLDDPRPRRQLDRAVAARIDRGVVRAFLRSRAGGSSAFDRQGRQVRQACQTVRRSDAASLATLAVKSDGSAYAERGCQASGSRR